MTGAQTIDRYKIVREIGGGSMGRVYEAEDTHLERRVAIKVLPIEYASDEGFRKRFLREARLAASLNHPNLVAIYDAGEAEGTWGPYLVMELVEGQSLQDLLKSRGPCRPALAAKMIRQAALGLHHAHSKGIIHRDVKPGNLLLSHTGDVKVADFGIARPDVSEMTRTGQLMGTPHYMAPEQITGEELDGRADVFALGVVLYQLLTGEKPFFGDTLTAVSYKVMNTEPPPVSAIRPSVPAGFDAILDRSLSKAPQDRYADAAAMARDLEAMEAAVAGGDPSTGEGLEASVPRAAPGPAPGPSSGRFAVGSLFSKPWTWVALSAVLALLLAAVWVLWPQGSPGPVPVGVTGVDQAGQGPEAGAGEQDPAPGSQDSTRTPQPPPPSKREVPDDSAAASPAGTPSLSGGCEVHMVFRHSLESGQFTVSLDNTVRMQRELHAEGSMLKRKEEIRQVFKVPAGPRTFKGVVGVPREDGSTEALDAQQAFVCEPGRKYPVFLKYQKIAKLRNLSIDWDNKRAKSELGF